MFTSILLYFACFPYHSKQLNSYCAIHCTLVNSQKWVPGTPTLPYVLPSWSENSFRALDRIFSVGLQAFVRCFLSSPTTLKGCMQSACLLPVAPWCLASHQQPFSGHCCCPPSYWDYLGAGPLLLFYLGIWGFSSAATSFFYSADCWNSVPLFIVMGSWVNFRRTCFPWELVF